MNDTVVPGAASGQALSAGMLANSVKAIGKKTATVLKWVIVAGTVAVLAAFFWKVGH